MIEAKVAIWLDDYWQSLMHIARDNMSRHRISPLEDIIKYLRAAILVMSCGRVMQWADKRCVLCTDCHVPDTTNDG